MIKIKSNTSEEIWELKEKLPLLLIFWIPQTIPLLMGLFYHIRWQYFGITEGINPYYTDRFKTSWDSYIWLISEIGWVGMIVLCFLAIAYLLFTYIIVILILNCLEWKNHTCKS